MTDPGPTHICRNRACRVRLPIVVLFCTVAALWTCGPASTIHTANADVALLPRDNSACAAPPVPRTFAAAMTVDGLYRRYLVHVPARLPAAGTRPLVILFHASGGGPVQIEDYTGMSGVADTRGMIVAYPEIYDNGIERPSDWVVQPDLPIDFHFVKRLIAGLVARWCVDSRRVAVAGFGSGGQMADAIACFGTPVVVAAGVAAPHLSVDMRACRPAHPVSVLSFHGTADVQVPIGGTTELASQRTWAGAWARRDGCRSAPRRTIGDETVESTFSRCNNGTSVRVYALRGAGHTWPGATTRSDQPWLYGRTAALSASRLILKFFAAHLGAA